MIAITARIVIKDGKRDDFLKFVRTLAAGSRREEGNIMYDLYEDIRQENAFCFMEQWVDEEAIAFHNATPHYKEWSGLKSELLASGEVLLYRKVDI